MLEADCVAGPLSDPAFADPVHRAKNFVEMGRAVRKLAKLHPSEELWRMGQEAGLPWGAVRAPEEALADEHLRARGHFVEIDHPELGRAVTYSGAPFVAERSPWRFERRPPLLGEHTDEILRPLA
jgi:crotonobetainyl-CoA:carnitine CoA-transferase CaiB-like acyl-CoA transferase